VCVCAFVCACVCVRQSEGETRVHNIHTPYNTYAPSVLPHIHTYKHTHTLPFLPRGSVGQYACMESIHHARKQRLDLCKHVLGSQARIEVHMHTHEYTLIEHVISVARILYTQRHSLSHTHTHTHTHTHRDIYVRTSCELSGLNTRSNVYEYVDPSTTLSEREEGWRATTLALLALASVFGFLITKHLPSASTPV
jgi:hypothetical protein